MNEKELKDLQLRIEAEQKAQSDAVAALKTASETQKAELFGKYEASELKIKTLSEQLDAVQLELKEKARPGLIVSPWADMKKSMTDKSVLAELKEGGQRTFELKVSTMDSDTELGDSAIGTAVVVPFRELGVGKAPDRRVTLLDVVQRAPVSSNRVSWVERTARTEGTSTLAAAAISENSAFVQSDMTYNQIYAPVEKIGTYIKVTNEALEDWDQLYSEIQNELFPMVERALELSVYQGTGTPPQLQGIIDTGIAQAYGLTTITSVVTPNIFDAARACIAQLATYNYYGPFTVFVNPVDGAKMDMPKNTDGSYLLPPFIGVDRRIIAGARVVESNMVDAGYILVGDFAKDTLFMRRGIEIKIWDQEASDAITDLKTITASVRACNRIKQPDYYAFVYDAIDDIVTAIS
jgi:HK97 family phage major capsid protein